MVVVAETVAVIHNIVKVLVMLSEEKREEREKRFQVLFTNKLR